MESVWQDGDYTRVVTDSRSGRWSQEHDCLSAAGWLAYGLRSGSGPRCLAGRSRQEALGREREQAACPPAGECEGAGHVCVLPTTAQLPPTSQVGLWTLPSRLPCPTSLFLPQSCSFGSTDGIKTAVSVGPQRDGIVASVPEEHACLPHRSEKAQPVIFTGRRSQWSHPTP